VLNRASEQTKVYSYEPDPRAISKFRNRIGEAEDVHFSATALSNESGEQELFLSRESSELTTMNPSTSSEQNHSFDSVSIETTTLDNEASRLGLSHIDLLKIDTEGHEASVLNGATTLLEEEAISCVQFEYGGAWVHAGETLHNVVSLLRSHGFEAFLLRPDCLKRVNIDLLGEYFSYSNFIAVHETKLNRIAPLVSPSSLL
jgi:FkbM family methyltransferase